MKRYDLVYDTSMHQRVMAEKEDGEYYLADDVDERIAHLEARLGEAHKLANGIDLRPWIDCACTTCQSNGKALERLLDCFKARV